MKQVTTANHDKLGCLMILDLTKKVRRGCFPSSVALQIRAIKFKLDKLLPNFLANLPLKFHKQLGNN